MPQRTLPRKTWMEQRSWFWRKIGFWFVPIRAAELGPEQWQKLLRFSKPSMSRNARRLFVVGWIALLAIYARIAFFIARMDARAAIGPVGIALLIAWFAFNRARISLSRPSLQDRALIEYDAEFESLQQSQRITLSEKYLRENLSPDGGASHDEREANLQLHAEAAAYSILRPGLILAVAGYWTFCLIGRFSDPTRDALVHSAIAFSFLALAILALPVFVRMWTQPNDPGEPTLVSSAHKNA